MSHAIINGRKIQVPHSGVYGKTLIDAAQAGPHRRVVMSKPYGAGTEFETIPTGKKYWPTDLSDKYGRPVKIYDIPDRTKGGISWGADRSRLSQQIITEQVIDIANNLFKRGISFDEENADWMIYSHYVMPQKWHNIVKETPILIVFPPTYPEIAPVGCYFKESIPQSPDGHLYNNAYHDACKDPLEYGWKWYCVFVNPEWAWQPCAVRYSGDWKNGDNLWTYLTLIEEALSSND